MFLDGCFIIIFLRSEEIEEITSSTWLKYVHAISQWITFLLKCYDYLIAAL
ncbi:conserved hypothetical protein [Trichinella spiralis]|uniref:hypothetical protein n=1 Tax=Trichinella spiralis TaxID=6334 RepID=UPI0001EFDF7B|nr:conserved hypothetical protein [Trichinella spiralis]